MNLTISFLTSPPPGNKKNQRRGQKRKLDENEPFVVTENEPVIRDDLLCLDWYNSDLTLKISEDNFMVGEPFYKEGWGYIFSSARATHGFTAGKVYYEVKLLENMESKLEGEKNLHELKFGWSTNDSILQLGESAESWCYAGSAKKGHDCKFEEYGVTFAKEDVVGAFLDLVGTKVTMTFTKNGETQGNTSYKRSLKSELASWHNGKTTVP